MSWFFTRFWVEVFIFCIPENITIHLGFLKDISFTCFKASFNSINMTLIWEIYYFQLIKVLDILEWHWSKICNWLYLALDLYCFHCWLQCQLHLPCLLKFSVTKKKWFNHWNGLVFRFLFFFVKVFIWCKLEEWWRESR